MPTLRVTRTRTSGDLRIAQYRHLLRDPAGNVVLDATGSYSTFTRFESFSDNKNRRLAGRYKDSDAIHTSIVSRLISDIPSYREGGGYSVTAVAYPPFTHPSNVLAHVPEFDSSHWDSFFLDAFEEMSTQIPEEISGWNFLWESAKISELLPRLEKTVRSTVSGGYLNLEFGWKPLLADLRTLGSLVSVIDARLSHLKAINGKTTRLGRFAPNVQTIPAWRPWSDGQIQYRLRSYQANLRVTGRLSVDLVDLDKESAFWRAAAVALGLTNPLKAFWESVPFSFLVDWFNRIGARTFNLAVNPFLGRYEVSRLNTSLTETAQIDCRWVYLPELNPPVNVGQFAVKRYTRYAGFPAQPSIMSLDALSPKKQTLLLALMNAK